MTDYSKMSDFEINKAVAEITGDSRPKVEEWGISRTIPDYCNNPADAWPLLLSIVEFGVTVSIGVNSINGEILGGKSITRKIAELYLGLQSD